MMMEQKDVNADTLREKVNELYARRDEFIEKMKQDKTLDGTNEVLKVIFAASK